MGYPIGKVAELAGVTVRTLHHYDEIGLLSPSERTNTGYRRYDDADLERLQQILYYRELEFSLEEIAAILDDPQGDATAHLRRQHRLLSRAHRPAGEDGQRDRVRDGGKESGNQPHAGGALRALGRLQPRRPRAGGGAALGRHRRLPGVGEQDQPVHQGGLAAHQGARARTGAGASWRSWTRVRPARVAGGDGAGRGTPGSTSAGGTTSAVTRSRPVWRRCTWPTSGSWPRMRPSSPV